MKILAVIIGMTFLAVLAAIAVLAVLMVAYRRAWGKHARQFRAILEEIVTIRDPNELAEIAAERKSSMLLLPYGIPIAIGSIIYFAWEGLLI